VQTRKYDLGETCRISFCDEFLTKVAKSRVFALQRGPSQRKARTLVKTVFFGTPEIAVPALEALAETTNLLAVVCQPDRPAGRKLLPRPCAVKLFAERVGIPVHQPERVKRELDTWLLERGADVAVVLAYGRILPASVLAAPRLGCVNLHASLLPEYRGAAPIARVLQDGRSVTGVSLMQMDVGLDTGPVFFRRSIDIADHWTAEDLTNALGALCATMVREDLPRIEGTTPVAQDDSLATHAPPIRAEETRIDWSLPATRLHGTVRAFSPAPGAHTFSRGKRVKLLETRPLPEFATSALPGTVVECSRGSLLVATGHGALRIERAQLEGKKPLAAPELVNGRAFALGDRLE
jgi:methionyl-tRNA formyltransferase